MGIEIILGADGCEEMAGSSTDKDGISSIEPLPKGGTLGPAFVYVPVKVAYNAMNAVDRIGVSQERDPFQNLRVQLGAAPMNGSVKAKPGELVLMQWFVKSAAGAERNCESVFASRSRIVELESLAQELQQCRRYLARSVLQKDI